MPKVRCRCGKSMEVKLAEAGQRRKCDCQRQFYIPSRSKLQSAEKEGTTIDLSNFIDTADEHSSTKTSTSSRDFNLVLTGSEKFFERISQEALLHYINQIERVIQKTLAQYTSTGSAGSAEPSKSSEAASKRESVLFQIAIALRQGETPILDIATHPEGGAKDLVGRLQSVVATIDPPPVRVGLIAFVLYRSLNSNVIPKFHFRAPFFTPAIPRITRRKLIEELYIQAPNQEQKVRPFKPIPQPYHLLLRSKKKLQDLFRRRAPEEQSHLSKIEDIGGKYHRDQLAELGNLGSGEILRGLSEYPNNPALWHRLGDIQRDGGSNREAIEAFTKAIELDPNNSLPLAARALAYCLDDSFQDGLADCNAAIEIAPHDIGHRLIRAELYADLGAWSEGERDLDEVIKREPWRPSVFVRRARFRLMQENRSGAISDLEAAVKLDPHNEDAYALRATILLRQPTPAQSDFRLAVADATRAIEIDPAIPAYYSLRGEAHALLNKFALAIEDCDQAIRIDKDSGFAYGVRGYANQQLELFEEAIEDCTRAIELSGGSPTIHISRAHAHFAVDEPEAAIEDCDSALEHDPENAAAYNLRGVIRMQQGDSEDAMADFAEAIRLAPDWASPYEHQAIVNRINSNDEDAIANLSRSLELTPSNVRALINRAFAFMDQNDFESAMKDLNHAVELDNELADSFLYRGQLFVRLNSFEKARDDLDKAIQLDSSLAEAYFSRGQLNLRERKFEAAIADLSYLVELAEDQPASYLARAHAWLEMGESEKAEADFSKAVELDPDSAEVVSIQKLLAKSQFYERRGEHHKAIELASEAIEMDSECYPAILLRANSYWYDEQWVEAVDDYTQLLDSEDESMPSRAMIYCNRGQVLAEMGEYEKALLDLEQAITMSEKLKDEMGLAFSLSGRALALTGMQKFSDAEHDFMRSLDLRPKNAWAHFNLALCYRQQGELEKAQLEMKLALESEDPPLSPRRTERAKAFLKVPPPEAE